ncbi:MAG: type II toxin-antitoxin system HicB family antitoxin [Cyanobacteria bacterium CRU_2_1]|nr:type II toxin-antitoxin system HicB family antitoxin [Cyanobacteria bacterium CRU_2_1]
MKKKYIYWQDDDMWLGYLEEYPDYWTQGETEDELRENLLDLYSELTGGLSVGVRGYLQPLKRTVRCFCRAVSS